MNATQGLKLVEATRKFLREGTFPRVVLGTTIIKVSTRHDTHGTPTAHAMRVVCCNRQNCTVLLFNDIVVLAVKKKNKYQAKSGKITLRGSYVWEDRAVKFGFTLVGREAADKITVEAATEQEKVNARARARTRTRTRTRTNYHVSLQTMWMDEVSQALVQLPHNSLIGGSSSPATAGTPLPQTNPRTPTLQSALTRAWAAPLRAQKNSCGLKAAKSKPRTGPLPALIFVQRRTVIAWWPPPSSLRLASLFSFWRVGG
jgi:hypothetical protein